MKTGACLAIAIVAAGMGACSTSDLDSPPVGTPDAAPVDLTNGDAAQTDDGIRPDQPGTTLRVAHLAVDLGDLDFCYRASSTDPYAGPILGGTGSPKDAGTIYD